jgi:hypothetical protein
MIRAYPLLADAAEHVEIEEGIAVGRMPDADLREVFGHPRSFPECRDLARAELARREALS